MTTKEKIIEKLLTSDKYKKLSTGKVLNTVEAIVYNKNYFDALSVAGFEAAAGRDQHKSTPSFIMINGVKFNEHDYNENKQKVFDAYLSYFDELHLQVILSLI